MTGQIEPQRFILMPWQTPLLSALDEIVNTKRLGLVAGTRGSGKSALVLHWLASRRQQGLRAIYANIIPSVGSSLPMACIVISRIWYALQQYARPPYLPHEPLSDDKIKRYSERQLQSLHLQVIEWLDRLHIQSIVLDNAHLLDRRAIEWTFDLRSYYDVEFGLIPRRAIILVAQSKSNENLSLQPPLKVIQDFDAVRAAMAKPLTMDRLSPEELFNALALLVLRNLHAEFGPDISSQEVANESLWLTGGDWWNLVQLVEILDKELGVWDGKSPRLIGGNTWLRVKAQIEERKGLGLFKEPEAKDSEAA